MKLLIVDDQSTVVQGLLHCTNWAAMGFTVVDTALNAVDAKASLLRQEAEVMLCDIEMPMESGLDLLDWLRQRGMTTRCIFLTAHAEFRYAQEALRLGGFDYIMQPAPYEQVADAVSRALENVKEERAALELQSRGAVFDDQKKEIVEMQGLHKTVFAKAPAMGKIWRDFGHAFSFASSSSRGIYPSPSYLIWMCCTRFPLDLSGAST